MPTWTSAAPKDPRGPSFPILRTPTSRPLIAIVTSENLIGCYTHFYKGRTIPCSGDDCPAHQEGVPFRWHAYQSARQVSNHLHFIFECTAQASTPFTEYRDAHKTLRGCLFEAQRYNSKPNGRILIRTKPADLHGMTLPEAPDLVKCLSILWDLPPS